jgi:antitoxin (DNA-binding transcriptional repressor) of toxin-antitoxin stability system
MYALSMTYIFNVHEAKTKLSQLLELALSGETVQLARNGEPVAEIVPIQAKPRPLFGEFKPFEMELTEEVLAPLFSKKEWEEILRERDRKLVQTIGDLVDEKSPA